MAQRTQKYPITKVGGPVALPEYIHDRFDITRCDIIGDVHGCYDELAELLTKLGREDLLQPDLPAAPEGQPPSVIFVGDIVDRGDKIMEALELVVRLCRRGYALMVLGNHDYRFLKWLNGQQIAVSHGLQEMIDQYRAYINQGGELDRDDLILFLDRLPYAIRFDGGKGVVVHAAWRPGMKEQEDPRKIRYYAIYGPTTGVKTANGFPDRIDWARSYKGPEYAIFGHQVYIEPYRRPFAIGIDTGCVYGGALTALRYPEKEIVSVKSRFSRHEYNGPSRPGGEG